MKFPSIQVLLLLAACPTGCADSTPVASSGKATYYGSVIETAGALSAAEVREALEANGRAEVVMAGEITATCPKKGCWMDVASGEDTVFVRFLDYGFFVPTEGVDGKQTVMKGEAFFDTLSVAELRHYAEDAGEDSATIAAITEPELQLAFTATGVMIAP